MAEQRLASARLVRATSLTDSAFDSVVVVSHCSKALAQNSALGAVSPAIANYLNINAAAARTASLLAVDEKVVPSGRLIYSATGPTGRDWDDVRRYQHAARDGIKLAVSAGSRSPLLVTVPNSRYQHAELVAAIGALHPAYVPLIVREQDNSTVLEQLGLLSLTGNGEIVNLVEAFDKSLNICRDVGDTDPQRMAPPATAQYIKSAFGANGPVKVEVTEDQEVIKKEYPLMATVNRAASQVPEHQARLIRLEYTGEGKIEKTFFLVGKGVTIDTGGVDVKTGGHMFGMSRDKYGSAVVAGFFKALESLRPKGIKVVGYMCMVRNSIDAFSYTCDEVINSRSGKRILMANTDAEGRITMLDPLTRAKDEALEAVNPQIVTLATLTGHEILTYGYYATIMENGPAKKEKFGPVLQAAGDEYGQPIEISRLHYEDFVFHTTESDHAHLRQGNTMPSVSTIRGHMTPAAFLMQGSRLDEHGLDSKKPLPFAHIDMGSCMGDFPKTSFPNPLVTLVAGLILPRI